VDIKIVSRANDDDRLMMVMMCNDAGVLQRRVDDVAKQLEVQRNRLNVRYT